MQPQPRLTSSSPTPQARHPAAAPPRLTLVWRRDEPADNRFTWRDRIELLRWADDEARALGVCRVRLEQPDPEDANHEVGDFALIYDASGEWARWAVAREEGCYLLWSPSTGRTIGRYPSLGPALAGIGRPNC